MAAASRIKPWRVASNRASNVGHPCLKYLVLNRTSWEEATLHDVDKQLLFDEGNHQEEIVLGTLRSAGVRVTKQQVQFHLKETDISGHIDGMVETPPEGFGKLYEIPIEIKSTSAVNFQRLATADDLVGTMLEGPWYHSMYPAQLLTYCLGMGSPVACWVFKNKVNGDIKDRTVVLEEHREYAQGIFARAAAVNEHMRAGTLPEGTEDPAVCEECGFAWKCHPGMVPTGQVQFLMELEWWLDLRDQLHEQMRRPKAELREVEHEIRTLLEGRDAAIVAGKWRGNPSMVQNAARPAYTYTKWAWEKLVSPGATNN
jgi:hypothetical protein